MIRFTTRNKYGISALLAGLMICSLAILGRASNSERVEEDFSRIDLIYSIPLYFPDKQNIALADTISIYESANYKIYRYPDKNSFENNSAEGNIKFWNSSVFSVFRKGRKYGFSFEGLRSPPKKLSVDSFLIRKVFGQFEYFNPNDVLLGKTKKLNGLITFTYLPVKNDDLSYPDSMYYYFDPNLNISTFSFAPILDSLKIGKLFQVVMVFNLRKIPEQNFEIPKRKFTWRIEKRSVDNKMHLDALLVKYNDLHAPD